MLIGLNASAQVTEQPFYLYGEVWDMDSKALLRNVLIRVVDATDTTKVIEGHSDDKGRYELGLPFDREFNVCYVHNGYLTKYISLDLHGVESNRRNGDHGMNAGIAMIRPQPQIDYTVITGRPSGICKLNGKGRKFMWDEAYSASLAKDLEATLTMHEKAYQATQQ